MARVPYKEVVLSESRTIRFTPQQIEELENISYRKKMGFAEYIRSKLFN